MASELGVQSLRSALELCDHVSPAPCEARDALLALREALARSLGISVTELCVLVGNSRDGLPDLLKHVMQPADHVAVHGVSCTA